MGNSLAQDGPKFAPRKDLIIAEFLIIFVLAVQDARANLKTETKKCPPWEALLLYYEKGFYQSTMTFQLWMSSASPRSMAVAMPMARPSPQARSCASRRKAQEQFFSKPVGSRKPAS